MFDSDGGQLGARRLPRSELLGGAVAALNVETVEGGPLRRCAGGSTRGSIPDAPAPLPSHARAPCQRLSANGAKMSDSRLVPVSPQRAAFFTSAPILASSAAVNFFRAKAVGQQLPSSRLAWSLKPNVAYLALNFCAL